MSGMSKMRELIGLSEELGEKLQTFKDNTSSSFNIWASEVFVQDDIDAVIEVYERFNEVLLDFANERMVRG